MPKTTKRAKRAPATSANPFDDPEYRRRAAAADKASSSHDGMVTYIRLQHLYMAETLARNIGVEGIAERRLELARDDEKFQSFMTEYVRPSREW